MIGNFKLGDPEPDAMTFAAPVGESTTARITEPAAAQVAEPATARSAEPAAVRVGERSTARIAEPAAATAAEPGTGAERDHAARVAAHEAATGWGPESAVRLASLTSRIAKLQRQSPVGGGPATIAVLAVLADLALAGLAIAGAVLGNDDLVDAGVLTLLAMFVPTVWAAWTLTRLVQRRREHLYRADRDRLRLDRGCGDRACSHCA